MYCMTRSRRPWSFKASNEISPVDTPTKPRGKTMNNFGKILFKTREESFSGNDVLTYRRSPYVLAVITLGILGLTSVLAEVIPQERIPHSTTFAICGGALFCAMSLIAKISFTRVPPYRLAEIQFMGNSRLYRNCIIIHLKPFTQLTLFPSNSRQLSLDIEVIVQQRQADESGLNLASPHIFSLTINYHLSVGSNEPLLIALQNFRDDFRRGDSKTDDGIDAVIEAHVEPQVTRLATSSMDAALHALREKGENGIYMEDIGVHLDLVAPALKLELAKRMLKLGTIMEDVQLSGVNGPYIEEQTKRARAVNKANADIVANRQRALAEAERQAADEAILKREAESVEPLRKQLALIAAKTRVQELLEELRAFTGDKQEKAAIVRRFAQHDGAISDAGIATIISATSLDDLVESIAKFQK
ncbi:MAG: hypothetical protein KAS32_03565 [Candidatus Peribacteraceae bacterium]|nr:hypothetical protein [Candidatus Peribacteraceae bacterium]